MVVLPRRKPLILPVAPLVAAVIGTLTAAIFALLPTGLLESSVVDSGVAAVLAVAEPPLGITARLVLALLCGDGIALVAWFALVLLLGTRSVVLGAGAGADEAPVLRRADAHPDAPARRPVFAHRDLGTPFLDVRARPVHVVAESPVPPSSKPAPEARAVPKDLDQPLAAYGPVRAPEEAADGSPARAEPVPRLPRLAPGERLETFPLTPMVRPPARAPQPLPPPQPQPILPPLPHMDAPAASPDASVTIHALLDRLERTVARREAAPEPVPEETLQHTLATLRALAVRGASRAGS